MHILVVEDDRAVSHCIQLMLGSVASTVHMTDLGEEGVELAKLNAYDIIFLDLNLPDRSGYEVLQFLRTANVNTPILILSGLNATASSSPFDLRGVSVTGEAGSDDLARAGAGRSSLIQRRHGGARALDRHGAGLLRGLPGPAPGRQRLLRHG